MKRLAVLLLLLPGLACANVCEDVYGGARVSGRNMGFKTGLGDNLFAKNNSLVEFSVFGGAQVTENFGAEVSLFTTNNDKRTATINGGNTILGAAMIAPGPDKYETRTHLYGTTLQATARYPIMERVKVFAAAGVGLAKMKLEANMIEADGAAATDEDKADNNFRLSVSKIYPVAKTGIELDFNEYLCARADIGWEGTSAFNKSFSTVGSGNEALQVKARNSFVYGLSIVASI